MKTKSSKVKFFAVCILFLAVFVSAPVSATDMAESTPILPTPVNDLRAYEIPIDSSHSGIVDDVSEYVETISNELDLNLSPEEINQYAVTLASHYLPATGKITPTSSIKVNDYSEFQQDVIDTLNLNLIKRNEYLQLSSASESLCATEEIINHNNPDSRAGYVIDPSTQSAPYAYGSTLYIPVFINFAGDVNDIWSYDDREQAIAYIHSGANVIKNRAPAAANMNHNIVYYTISVSGIDDGQTDNTWGDGGWMDEAASNLGYTATSNQRSTEVMARYLENYYNVDSVIFIYCIHDVGRSYALLPQRGYVDSCVLYFWREFALLFKTENEANVYSHEILHLYGALDEYPEEDTYLYYSYMSVSPLSQWYQNTNHHENPNHQHSIMCSEGLYGVSNPIISQSTKNFIGWGDKDGDGIIDVVEIRAGTA